MDLAFLFAELFASSTETAVDAVIGKSLTHHPSVSWHPLGGNESNYGVVENQQSSPIAALIEKVINSIDAILMRKCAEAGLDPLVAVASDAISDSLLESLAGPRRYRPEPEPEQVVDPEPVVEAEEDEIVLAEAPKAGFLRRFLSFFLGRSGA